MLEIESYYDIIKIAHVVSAAVLFGTGFGTAAYMFFAHFNKNLKLRAQAYSQVVFADWCFTTPSAIFQAVSGFAMIFINGYLLHQTQYHWSTFWVMGSIIGYSIAGVCWLPVLYLQTQMKNMVTLAALQNRPLPRLYYRYFYSWVALGIPAFTSLVIVYYLMANRPITF